MALRGQDAAGNVGGRPISSTGGQFSSPRRLHGKGGRAILAATARDAKGKSRFVPMGAGRVAAVPEGSSPMSARSSASSTSRAARSREGSKSSPSPPGDREMRRSGRGKATSNLTTGVQERRGPRFPSPLERKITCTGTRVFRLPEGACKVNDCRQGERGIKKRQGVRTLPFSFVLKTRSTRKGVRP